jgi:hypothetical protein
LVKLLDYSVSPRIYAEARWAYLEGVERAYLGIPNRQQLSRSADGPGLEANLTAKK